MRGATRRRFRAEAAAASRRHSASFQLRRIHAEELVLTATTPEYAAYQAKTARLIPDIY